MLFQSVAKPHSSFTTQDMDCRLMALVFVRRRPSPGEDNDGLQMDASRPHGLRRDTRRAQMPLPADEFCSSPDHLAGRFTVVCQFRHSMPPYVSYSLSKCLSIWTNIRRQGASCFRWLASF